MPLQNGTKSPAFAHKNGRWSWYSYLTKQTNRDVGVLLVDLCVVDVDCHNIAATLEAKFAILNCVPCEITEKGRHYFFARSDKADIDGYYDGARQKNSKVDFKSVCWNGTSGLLVVTPSSGKTWRKGRAPWECFPNGQLPPIPDELLLQIGRAQHEPINCVLEFPGDGATRVINNCNFLAGSAYLDIFLRDPLPNMALESDQSIVRVPFPTQYRGEVFDDVYRVCVTGMMRVTQIEVETMSTRDFRAKTEAICNLADFLALPSKYDRIFRPPYGCLWSIVRLHEISRKLCSSALIESAWRFHLGTLISDDHKCVGDIINGSEDEWHPFLISITPDVAAKIKYRSVHSIQQCRLFPERPPISSVFIEGASTIHTDIPGLILPSIVETILRKGRGQMILAGGSVLGKIAKECLPGADYDFFLYGIEEEHANFILKYIGDLPEVSETSRSEHAVSFRTADIIFQIITRLFRNPAEILLGFDIPACRVGIHIDIHNCRHVWATPSWVECMRCRAIWIDETLWSTSSAVRLCKYYCKGFDVFLPGLTRTAFNHSIKLHQELNRFDGISLLFAMEHQLHWKYRRGAEINKRISRMWLEKFILTSMRGHCVCDYMTVIKTTKIRDFLMSFWSSFTSNVKRHKIRAGGDLRPVIWSRPRYDRPICGTFVLSPAQVEDILDLSVVMTM